MYLCLSQKNFNHYMNEIAINVHCDPFSQLALLETPSGKKIEPTITPIPEEPGKYEIAYVPEETGNHKLNVKYGKDHVKDSPFRVKVAPTGDASKVKVSGDGLKKPPVGQLVDIIFDTTEAGKGWLA